MSSIIGALMTNNRALGSMTGALSSIVGALGDKAGAFGARLLLKALTALPEAGK